MACRPLHRTLHKSLRLGLGLTLLASAGCPQDPPKADGDAPPGFEAAAPSAYTAKVKDLLVGQAPTDAELTQVTADPQALPGLIDRWMGQPEFQEKMLGLFQQAFQQTQTSILDYDDQLGYPTMPWNPVDKINFVRSAEESFARTAWQLIQEGRPFTEVLTTDRFMLNAPLLSAMAFMDTFPKDDQGAAVVGQIWVLKQIPNFRYVRETKEGPIPLEQTIDPKSPNFMKWYDPRGYSGPQPNCQQDPFVIDPTKAQPGSPQYYRLAGQALVEAGAIVFGGRLGCGPTVSQFLDEDWSSWRMVKVRRPAAGEARTLFFDLPSLRKATELVAGTPRIGFMTTPAFFANWPTNLSNLDRVTINQTMIVGLGKSFDDSNITVQVSETTKPDEMHVDPTTPCYGCHRTMDPMRDFFRASFSVSYSAQFDPVERKKTGTFELDGVKVTGSGIGDLAKTMATHPRFATAWTQKLCRYANSSSCVEDDPEFLRVAKVFQDSGYSFKALVRELFSSPLVTAAAATKTTSELGVTISISRREHLCAALGNRLGIADACGLQATLPRLQTPTKRTARNLALSVPGAGYARGAETPLMPHDPSLFFVSATENLCGLVAGQVIDAGQNPRYSSKKPSEAIADFVRTLMALPPSDPRAAAMGQILSDHYAAATQAGETAGDALKSTFVLACESPLAVSSGL